MGLGEITKGLRGTPQPCPEGGQVLGRGCTAPVKGLQEEHPEHLYPVPRQTTGTRSVSADLHTGAPGGRVSTRHPFLLPLGPMSPGGEVHGHAPPGHILVHL